MQGEQEMRGKSSRKSHSQYILNWQIVFCGIFPSSDISPDEIGEISPGTPQANWRDVKQAKDLNMASTSIQRVIQH